MAIEPKPTSPDKMVTQDLRATMGFLKPGDSIEYMPDTRNNQERYFKALFFGYTVVGSDRNELAVRINYPDGGVQSIDIPLNKAKDYCQTVTGNDPQFLMGVRASATTEAPGTFGWIFVNQDGPLIEVKKIPEDSQETVVSRKVTIDNIVGLIPD